MWIFNPEWKILPSIAFVENRGPVVLTCYEHDGGTSQFMIHPCRWHHNLSSRKPDQLCQAVVQPRILKPVKASKYSTSFQMFHQTGTFNGIDTCSATSYGNFHFRSKLMAESEARSISNRPDINAHLSKLRSENVISKFVESGKRNFANRYSNSIDYPRFTKGATYVSLEASIVLQNEMTDRKISAWLDHRESQPIRFSFKKYWPYVLFPCQTMTSHGVVFPKVPMLTSNDIDTSLIWTVAALLCRVEPLWKIVCQVELRTSNWHGWMLVYLTKHCFNQGSRKQSRNDPFKMKFMNTIIRFRDKVQHAELNDYFRNLNKVFYCNLIDDNGNTRSIQEVTTETEESFDPIKVIIANQFDYNNTTTNLDERLSIEGISFELMTVVGSRKFGNIKWDGVVFSRHSGDHFSKWWFDERKQNQPIQIEGLPSLPYNDTYTLVYVRIDDIDISSMRNEFLKSLGGQNHVQCLEHQLPLIASMNRENKCKKTIIGVVTFIVMFFMQTLL
jgi:hypothetical protein